MFLCGGIALDEWIKRANRIHSHVCCVICCDPKFETLGLVGLAGIGVSKADCIVCSPRLG
jgi:hypothetical protein